MEFSTCYSIFVFLLATCVFAGVDGVSEFLTTNGRDMTHKVTLSQRVNLYGEYHTSLFVHSRGFVALGEKDVRRVDMNRFQENKLIVPYYNEIYLKKTVEIQTVNDATHLREFSTKVKTHFSEERKFEAKELLTVVWNVYTQFSNASMQTITLVMGSDGDQTHILLTYERNLSHLYQNFLHFVYGTSIAGFSAGDGVRYHEIFGNYANELFTEKLSKLSNIGSKGNWMFKLGDVGGLNKNFAIKSADRKLFGGNVVDNDECGAGVSQCHIHASCSNRNLGYICQCERHYMGNGKICLKRDSSVYVRGYINGQVNGHEIYDSDHTILVQPASGDVDVTVIPLKKELGNVFRVLPMIHGLITWLFTKSDAEMYGKGFDIVGDKLVAKTLINFIGDPSELYITQKIKGISNGALSLVTTITGNTPEFGEITKIDLTNITEVFQEGSEGTTSSISVSNIIVNDKKFGVKVSRLVIYDPSMKKISGLKHELDMKFYPETFSSYSTRSGLYMKFQANIKNIKDESCVESGCGANSKCVSTRDGAFVCQCNRGFVKKESKCIAEDTKYKTTDPSQISCTSNPCGENSKCINTEDSFRCDCDPGFTKTGLHQCTDVDECKTGRACADIANSVCVNRPGNYACVCKPGFKTTQTGCEGQGEQPELRTCGDNPCGDNARCVDTHGGGFSCQCKPGFTEVAKNKCEDINECTSRPCSHLTNAKCVNTPGYYKCVCSDAGFKMTREGCILDPCSGGPCKGLNTRCVDTNDGKYKCKCKRGYAKDGGGNCVGVQVVVEDRTCRDNPCGDNSRCVDVNGAFTCECKHGYKKVATDCVDINECVVRKPCEELLNSVCKNKDGSYACECKPGYKRNGGRCTVVKVDQRTCKSKPCGEHGRCTDIDGGIRCDCEQGFARIGTQCLDMNECDDLKVCAHIPNTVCENRLGSHRCKCKPGYRRTVGGCESKKDAKREQRTCRDKPCGDNAGCVDTNDGEGFKCECNVGYTKDHGNCVDVNECAVDVNACAHIPNSACVNMPGSYGCPCKPAFKSTVGGCIAEKDAKREQQTCGDNPCGDNAKCTDIDGGIRCECKQGFSRVGSQCLDVNECENRRTCAHIGNTVCENRVGSFRCVCKPGYKRTVKGCEVDNICSTNPCGDNAECVDLGTDYTCKCNPGFRKKGSTCVDIDECQRYGVCRPYKNTVCNNLPGRFQCTCKTGYEKKGNDGGCRDINECKSRKDLCYHVENSQCVNREATFTCECKQGFTNQNGKCVVDTSTCKCGENQECYNVRGQNFCRCKNGFEYEYEKCIDLNECRSGTFKCMDNAECVNTPGSYVCRCKVGYTKSEENCINFARFKGIWSISFSGDLVDEYTIGTDGRISVKSLDGRMTSTLTPSNDNTNSFPYSAGWFEAKNVRRPSSIEYLRLNDGDGTLEIHHFCTNANLCNRNFGALKGTYCCEGKGIKDVEDVDECASGAHKCTGNTQCVNTHGSYKCECKDGYKRKGRTCEDVDECLYDMCGKQAVCTNTIGSFTCKCYQGFHQTAGNICTDIDECDLKKDEACGKHATCVNIRGGYKCDCPINHVFASNGRDCERACTRCLNGGKCVGINQCQCAEGYSGDWCQFKSKDDFLLFAQSGTIKRLSYPYRSKHFGYLHTAYGNNLVGVDYDCKDSMAYYSDMSGGEIARLTYNGLNRKVILKDLKNPEGLSVDWVGRNVFWVESGSRTVNVATLDGYYARTLFKDNIVKPRAITNNPFTGKIYWTDWERTNPRIECSNMDASKREVFVNSLEVTTPNGLAINHGTQELCWTDAGKNQIACKHMKDGTVRVLVTKISRPFSLTFHKEHLFWTDWVEDKIQKYSLKNLKRGNGLQTGVAYDGRLYDVKSVQACPKACEEVGFDYIKYTPVETFDNTTTWRECRLKCKMYEGCRYWSWSSTTNTCVLKDGDGERQVKEGVVSGAKNCEIAPGNPCGKAKGGCEYICLMNGPYTKKCVSPDKVGFTFNETE